jgi:hypothetical protein
MIFMVIADVTTMGLFYVIHFTSGHKRKGKFRERRRDRGKDNK